jgi:hypothetical protein
MASNKVIQAQCGTAVTATGGTPGGSEQPEWTNFKSYALRSVQVQCRYQPGWLNITRGGRDIHFLDKLNSMPGMICQTTELQSRSSKSVLLLLPPLKAETVPP